MESSKNSLELVLKNELDPERPIYISGNFNEWKVGDPTYKMHTNGDGTYHFTFPNYDQLPNMIEYKYTRGSWSTVEIAPNGKGVPNRVVEKHKGVLNDRVDNWMGRAFPYKNELLPKIEVISEQFEMPQLIRTRRVAALLPHNYYETDKRYPVLYLQDGQNLFDEYAPFGNWAVDKQLAKLSEIHKGDVIVVAIDHAKENRIKEFNPTSNTHLGSGQGKKYTRFLTETLKPYIDSHFRTLPDRANTAIGGSSMGGLISIYAGLMYPNVYSKLMVFSPSLWVAPNIHFHSMNLLREYDIKIYLYAGGSESLNMVPNINRFKSALENQGSKVNVSFKLNIDPNGTHNEARWGEEFPAAVTWLFDF